MSYLVTVGYDEAEHRYYVISSDIAGLHIESSTFEEFVAAAQDAAQVLVSAPGPAATLKFEREVAFV